MRFLPETGTMLGNHILLFLLFVGLLTNWFEPLDAVAWMTDLPEICKLPKVPKHCKMTFRGYFYDVTTGTCQLITYRSCGANANIFLNKQDCITACQLNG